MESPKNPITGLIASLMLAVLTLLCIAGFIGSIKLIVWVISL